MKPIMALTISGLFHRRNVSYKWAGTYHPIPIRKRIDFENTTCQD
jgi:hypothetical protein